MKTGSFGASTRPRQLTSAPVMHWLTFAKVGVSRISHHWLAPVVPGYVSYVWQRPVPRAVNVQNAEPVSLMRPVCQTPRLAPLLPPHLAPGALVYHESAARPALPPGWAVHREGRAGRGRASLGHDR